MVILLYLTLQTVLHQQNMIKSAKAAEKQQGLVKVLEQEKKTLEHEINAYRQKAQQERKMIQQLEKERDRYINENGNLIQKAGWLRWLRGTPFWFLTWTLFLLAAGSAENEWQRSAGGGDFRVEEEGYRGWVQDQAAGECAGDCRRREEPFQ